ncbi:uncharacterized protein LOC143299081 [Babylonia areolata]|uniref:uncharacterized protein LOC143299081 n=1 Tax=Babylonia areolata TaxID=304850 RepID=UPI003FD50AC0
MGGSESKGQVLSNKPPPPAQAMPPEPPYPGPPAQYHFINTDVVIGTQMTFSFTHSPMVTSNIDSYYPLLAGMYGQGYRLLSFYRIPGQQQQQGLFSMSVALGFQGIFCCYPTAPRRENWQLRIEKSVIQLQRMYTGIISFNQGVVSDTSHVLDSIARNTQGGGRLICVEMTGQQQSASMGMAMQGLSPAMGVDLFFEVPDTPGATQYVYNCVSVPITMTMQMGFRPVPIVHCDWIGVLANNLNQGWRLIEIFMDKTQHTRPHGFTGQSTLNSMWFFEKPASRMNDPTPVYQGTMIDHQVKIKTSLGGTNATANWEPVIQDMGNRGWELACILETPEVRFSGMATIYMTCKMFFQRPIPPPAGASMPSGLPPPYDLAVGGFVAPPVQGAGPVPMGGPVQGGPVPMEGPAQGAVPVQGGEPSGPPPPPGFQVAPPPEKMGY